MTTKNIVPRATGEGNIGTAAKKWASVNADELYGKLQIGELTEISSAENADYLTIYDATDSDIKKIAVSNFSSGSGGINTIDVRPENFQLDDTHLGVSRGSAFSMLESLDFSNTSNGSVWYSFIFPSNWSTDSDISIEISYSLNGVDSGKTIKFDVRAWLVSLLDQPDSGVPDYSGSDNITSSSDNTGKYYEKTLTNGTITAATIPTGCKSVVVKLTRDSASDTYTGTLQVLGVKISQ